MNNGRRVDIGVCSYRNPQRLRATLETIRDNSVTDWRCWIIHNESYDEDGLHASIIGRHFENENPRFKRVSQANRGYAGAVNRLMHLAETEYVLYCDNDVEILKRGWDELFCQLLDAHREVGQVFPGSGHFRFFNGDYHECLWNAGYCWAIRRKAAGKVEYLCREITQRQANFGLMDTSLGHHEEVDLMIRLRLAGYRIACIPDVQVLHHETATQDEAAHKPGGRIHDGVVRWMNKWNRYFCGEDIKYSMTEYDPRALRYTDWPPCALYLERMTLAMFPDWNASPRSVQVPGVGPMDAVEVLKPAGPYKGRAI